jgi:hypothetical protein
MEQADPLTGQCPHQLVPWFHPDHHSYSLMVENDNGLPTLITFGKSTQGIVWPTSVSSLQEVKWSMKPKDLLDRVIHMGDYLVSAPFHAILQTFRLDGSSLTLVDSLELSLLDGIKDIHLHVMDRCEGVVVHMVEYDSMHTLSRVRISLLTGKMELVDTVSVCHLKSKMVSNPTRFHEGRVRLITPRGLFRHSKDKFFYDWDSVIQLGRVPEALDWTGLPVALLNLIDEYAVGESIPWILS